MIPVVTRLLASLGTRDVLSRDECAVLQYAPWRIRNFQPEDEIIAEGSEPADSCLLVEGFAGRSIMFADGRRQITALQVPGDFVDLHSMLLKVMDHNVTALTDVTVAFLSHEFLNQLTNTHPHLWRVLATQVAIDGAIQRNWIAGLGRRTADSQLAHLLCETYLRLSVVGLTKDNDFSFPITQLVLADLQGLSIVHVNRMLQVLRTKGMVGWVKNTVTIKDWDKLASFAEFDATYLNLVQRPR